MDAFATIFYKNYRAGFPRPVLVIRLQLSLSFHFFPDLLVGLTEAECHHGEDHTQHPRGQQGDGQREGMTVGVLRTPGKERQDIGNGHPQSNGGQNGDPHGGNGIAAATHDAAQHLGNGHADVPRRHDLHHPSRQINEGFRRRKDGEQVLIQEQQHHHDHRRKGLGNEAALNDTLLDPVKFPRANVLAGVNGHSLAEGEVGHHGKAVHTHDHYVGGNELFSELVGQGLYNDHGGGEDGLGQTGRKTEPDQGFHILRMGTEILQFEIKELLHPGQLDQTENGGDNLGNDGCQCHTGDSQFQSGNKIYVQNNVDNGCHQQIDQCGNGVAHAADDPAENVVVGKPCNTHNADDQIVGTPVQNGRRCVQHDQHRPDQRRCCQNQNHAADRRDGDTVADGLGQTFPVFRAEILGYHDAGSGRDTDEQNQQHIDDGACAAYGGKCVVTYVFPNDDGIHCVVQLLGDVAEQHGEGELQDAFPGGSDGHIRRCEYTSGHGVFSLY